MALGRAAYRRAAFAMMLGLTQVVGCDSEKDGDPTVAAACSQHYSNILAFNSACASCAETAPTACKRGDVEKRCSSFSTCVASNCFGYSCRCEAIAKCLANAGADCSDAARDYYECSNARCATACGTPPWTSCGDGVCSAGESCSTCPQDCGGCTTPQRCLNPGGSPPGLSCSADAQCCSNYCKDGTCESVHKRGDPCEAGVDSCEGYCNGTSCACNPPGSSCSIDGSDPRCCSFLCRNGKCTPDGVQPRGTPCTENRWCIQAICESGRCGGVAAPIPRCRPYETSCSTEADCCSGTCSAGLCTCRANGTSCTTDANCCNRACVGGACR